MGVIEWFEKLRKTKRGQMESSVFIMQYFLFIWATFPVIQLSSDEKDDIVSSKAVPFVRARHCVPLFQTEKNSKRTTSEVWHRPLLDNYFIKSVYVNKSPLLY